MGKGIALEARERYPELPAQLGRNIKATGNTVYIFLEHGLITFPTKENYWEQASLALIERSARCLKNLVTDLGMKNRILIPRPGCGAGRLQWKQVKPVLEPFFRTDQYIIFRR